MESGLMNVRVESDNAGDMAIEDVAMRPLDVKSILLTVGLSVRRVVMAAQV